MKRKYRHKSGSEKRIEKKRDQLKQAAAAQGQTSLLNLFGKKPVEEKNDRTRNDGECSSGGEAAQASASYPLGPEPEEACDTGEKSDYQNVPIAELETEDLIDKEPISCTAEEADANNNGPNKRAKNDDAPSSSNPGCSWYKGNKLEINWLLLSNSCLEASKRTFKEDRARQYITCMLCQQYELEVKKFTVNGRLPIANGIRADGKDRLKSIVDHLQSSAHEEAIRLQENDEAWRSMSDSHPWARVMKKSKAETLNLCARCLAQIV